MSRTANDDLYANSALQGHIYNRQTVEKYGLALAVLKSRNQTIQCQHIAAVAGSNRSYPAKLERCESYGIGKEVLRRLLRVYLHIAKTGELPPNANGCPEEWPAEEAVRVRDEIQNLVREKVTFFAQEKVHGASNSRTAEVREGSSVQDVARS